MCQDKKKLCRKTNFLCLKIHVLCAISIILCTEKHIYVSTKKLLCVPRTVLPFLFTKWYAIERLTLIGNLSI